MKYNITQTMDISENEKSLKFKMAKTVLGNPIKGTEGDIDKNIRQYPYETLSEKTNFLLAIIGN